MKVETGIIAAAGSGTRLFPVTLGYPKALLPVINKPALQLIIDEFIDSGLKRIVVVTGANPEPIHRQYDINQAPPRGLYRDLDAFIDKIKDVEIIFEPQRGPYGNGTPLMVAREHIPAGEGFIYAYGDDIVKSATPFVSQMIEKHARTSALVAGVQEVPWEDVHRYGVVSLKDGGKNLEIDDVVEKPSREEARSNLVMFGRFLLSSDIIDILKEIPLGKSNELWLTDSIREFIRRGGLVVAHPTSEDARWLTIGDPVNYLKTVFEYAMSDPELRPALEPFFKEMLNRKSVGTKA